MMIDDVRIADNSAAEVEWIVGRRVPERIRLINA
jgi:hypothetical protein